MLKGSAIRLASEFGGEVLTLVIGRVGPAVSVEE